MKSTTWVLLAALCCLVAACGTLSEPPGNTASGPPPGLVAAAPGASPTATPFQPPMVEQGTQNSPYNIDVPTLEPFLSAATATAPEAPSALPNPTVDLSSLFPAGAAPPIPDAALDAPARVPPLVNNDTINFLLIGSDKRSGGSYRTDTMVVVVLWRNQNQVSLISLPRDLWIYIPGTGMQRINTAYESGEIEGYSGGGAALLRDTIAYNLGLRIDHTAMIDFDGFRRIVNALGGVDVPVACPYTDWHLNDPTSDPNDANNWSLYTVPAGIAHMDGDLALWYARSRLQSDDFDRSRRQQEALRAILGQALRTHTLDRIAQLYAGFSKAIATDLAFGDIFKLALYAPNLTNANIRSYYIRPPYVSEWTTPAGAEVLLPNQNELEQLLVQATTLSTAAVHRQEVTIEVQNGTAADGMDGLAASRLNYAGYTTRLSAADRRDYPNSVLSDLTSAQDPAARATILDGLGLSSATVVSSPDPKATAQYRLVVGSDYQPCFKPQDLSH